MCFTDMISYVLQTFIIFILWEKFLSSAGETPKCIFWILSSMGRNRTSVCVIIPASPDSLIFAADSLRRALIFYFPVCSTFFSCISLLRPQTKNWTHGMLIYMFTEVHGLESCLWPTKADLCRDSASVSRTMAPSFRQGDSDIIDIRSLAGPVGTRYLASN